MNLRLRFSLRAIAPSRPSWPHRQNGAALVVVLAFVVLLTGLVMAFLAGSLNNRKLAGSSVNQTKVELFAQGALDTVINDLQQEIADGSTNTLVAIPTGNVTIYTPSGKRPPPRLPSCLQSPGSSKRAASKTW